MPNVINLKLTECEGAGAESLLEAVDLTLLKFELTDCNSNFMIPESVEMPNIRELSITTMYGVMTLELNLTKVGRTLEKLVVKGGVIFSPGVPLIDSGACSQGGSPKGPRVGRIDHFRVRGDSDT